MSRRSFLCYHELHNTLAILSQYFAARRRVVPRDLDLARGDAYLVAAHAAIEYFFETLCRRALYASLWRFKSAGTTNKILNELGRTYIARQVSQLPRVDPPFHANLQRLDLSARWYVGKIDDNNGIRSRNLLALLLPLGFDESDFDPVWLDSMDSFGRGRGDMAHGRPITPASRPPLAIGGAGGVTIGVWTREATRARVAQPVWDVQATVDSLRPEMLSWDRKLTTRIDLA